METNVLLTLNDDSDFVNHPFLISLISYFRVHQFFILLKAPDLQRAP